MYELGNKTELHLDHLLVFFALFTTFPFNYIPDMWYGHFSHQNQIVQMTPAFM